MSAATRAAAPAPAGINFGDLKMYAGGQFIPDGDYIMFFNAIMHQPTDKQGATKGPARLGTMVDFYPLATPTEEHKLQQFYSMGSKADQSFAPNPETGKGIVAIPGAAGTTLNDKTNWFMLINSLYQSGLPQGVFSNDLSTIDGVWAHITNVDEPAERAGFQSTTAEVAAAPRTPSKIAVVTEILEGGAPWEGSGGIPAAAPAAKTPPAKGPVAKVAPIKPPAKPPVAAAPVPEAAGDDDVRNAASAGITDVITAKPNGLPRLTLRTETFKAVKKTFSEEMASSVISTFFEAGGEEGLNGILGELGYKIEGTMVKPNV